MRPWPAPGTSSVTASPPASSSRQKASRSAAPGKRQAMPTIAIGSPWPEAGSIAGPAGSLVVIRPSASSTSRMR